MALRRAPAGDPGLAAPVTVKGGHHLAPDLAAVAKDRIVAGVFRHQPDVVLSPPKRLDHALLPEQSDHDVTVDCVVLLTDHQAVAIAAKMKVAEQRNRELAGVKAKYLERQKQADNYKHRVDVIDQLRKAQIGPVNLLDTLGQTVNGTEAVWLNSMKTQGANISIQGMALSADAVANLISNLQKSGYFKNIEIKETFQDDSVKDMQAFQFELTCEIDRSKS